MIKTYSQAVKFLEGFIPAKEAKYPGKFGFQRMGKLMDLLGNPQLKYRTIHIGGTSGKGSTATILASILGTKYKVGLNTSPHLEKYTERIKINGVDISEKEFVFLINEIRPFVLKMEKSSFGKPSHFEVYSAMAFLYFFLKKSDIVVVEVGMGGRWDGTNVVKPEVAILTNVGLDHTQVLGDTVEKIATDKAGIIKKGIEVVSGVKQESVIKIVGARIRNQEPACRQGRSGLSLLRKDFDYKIKKIGKEGSVFDYFGKKAYRDLELGMLGEHQIENATLAIRAIEQCSNVKITEQDIRKGLKNAFIPGRMEIVKRNPMVILDGAHNPDKIKALVSSLEKIFPGKRIRCLLAIKHDKNARKMIRQLLPICQEMVFSQFHIQTDLGDTLSYKPEELFGMAQEFKEKQLVRVNIDPLIAVENMIRQADKDDLILVTGSLYLVGEARKFLISNY